MPDKTRTIITAAGTWVDRSTTGWSLLIVCALATAGAAPAAAADSVGTPSASTVYTPYIVNGTVTSAYPTTGALLIYGDASQTTLSSFCSGTLIGCHSFLTAAHCVCPDTTASAPECQSQGVNDPSTLRVFLQHGGLFGVTRVEIDPDYVFAQGGDLALVTLSEPVTGIAPSPINTLRRPDAGTAATVVGFGSTVGGHSATNDGGIKREGAMATALCTGGLPNETNICWNFLGAGADTCEGDSGGPLFIDVGSAVGTGAALAGVTSGGGASCQAPDLPFDSDVFVCSAWITSQAGTGLSSAACGTLTPGGTGSTTVLASTGQLTAAQPEARWDVTVPAGTTMLRIALNGVPWSGQDGQTVNDANLYVRAGSAPTTSQYDCRDANPTPFGFCEFTAPAAGSWSVLVKQGSGEGLYQLTATAFGPATSSVCPGDCNHDGTVTVDELLTSVAIALGSMEISACRACDTDGDGEVLINELLAAVNAALNGC
jgi:hypothetical protein